MSVCLFIPWASLHLWGRRWKCKKILGLHLSPREPLTTTSYIAEQHFQTQEDLYQF